MRKRRRKMCGRYTLAPTAASLTATFPDFELPDQLPPRYNITPTQEVAVVANNNPAKIELFRWGLIPSWAQTHIHLRGQYAACHYP